MFVSLLAVVVLFQLALFLGAPWGHLAMGGRFPGKFPTRMRVAALVQGLLLSLLGVIVLVRAGMAFPDYYETSKVAIWIVVLILSLSLVMNLLTPSKWERIIWAPVVAALVVCSLVIARSG